MQVMLVRLMSKGEYLIVPKGTKFTGSGKLGLNESPYFCHYNPKISAPNSLYFGSYNRKCTYFWYTNFDFLMYFHNSLIPSATYLFFAPGEKIKSNLEVKLYKMCHTGQGQSV